MQATDIDLAAPRSAVRPARQAPKLNEVIFFAALIILIQLTMGSKQGVLHGHFVDTDAYSWLNRVQHLQETQNWFDRSLPRVNPPQGHLQHWSRPFDVLLYAGAAIGSPFVGFDAALEFWAIWVSPFLQILTLLILFYSTRPLFPDPTRCLPIVGFLFIAQVALFHAFEVGRPDHQGLLLLIAAALMGCTVRMLNHPMDLRWCHGAGALTALGLWVSVEFMLIAVALHVCLGLAWLRDGASYARLARQFSTSAWIATVLAVLAHTGWSGLSGAATDEISGLYVLLMFEALLFWGVMEVSAGHGWQQTAMGKSGIAALGVLVAVILIALVLPQAISTGPLGDVTTLYETTRLRNLGELQNLVGLSQGDLFGLVKNILPMLGIPTIALIAGCLILRRFYTASDSDGARRWLAFIISATVFVPLACYQVRWLGYAALFSVPLATLLVVRWSDAWRGRGSGWSSQFAGSLPLMVVVLGFNAPALLPAAATTVPPILRGEHGSTLSEVARHLSAPTGLGAHPQTLMAFVDFGPELMYRTPHAVFSMPNHRPQPGFVESFNAMTAADPGIARAIVARMGVDLILVSTHPLEGNFYRREDGQSTFHRRLVEGRCPGWLSEIALPPKFGQGFRLFEVRHSRTPMS